MLKALKIEVFCAKGAYMYIYRISGVIMPFVHEILQAGFYEVFSCHLAKVILYITKNCYLYQWVKNDAFGIKRYGFIYLCQLGYITVKFLSNTCE